MDPQFPDEPKRMRWRTYSALKRKDAALRSHFLKGEVDLVRTLSRCLGRVRIHVDRGINCLLPSGVPLLEKVDWV
jgi:hypothetical protein